jgi:hypothetical protein
MNGAGRWLAVSSTITVVVCLTVGSGTLPAHPVVPEAVGELRASAVAEQARRDGVDANEVVDTVRRGRASDARLSVAARPRLGPKHPVSEAVPATAGADQDGPKVAFDGTNYLVVWGDLRGGVNYPDNADVFGARVSRSGVVLDTTGIPIATVPGQQFGPDVVFNGTDFLVVWMSSGPDRPNDVLGTRVSRSGSVRDRVPIPIATGPEAESAPAVAFDGTNVLVVWTGGDGVSGSRVSPAGVVLDRPGIPISAETGSEVVLAFDGINHLVVWETFGTDRDLSAAVVSPQGAVVARQAIVAEPGDQSEPAIAFDGVNSLLTWRDDRADYMGDISGTRVDPAGNGLDTTRIRITSAAGRQVEPAVAFDGTNYLVTWTGDGSGFGIHGARVTPEGVVLDGDAVPIVAQAGTGAVAFDGGDFLVVARSFIGGSTDISGVRVTRAATPVGDDFVVSTATNAQRSPAVAFDGTNYLVVWSDDRDGDNDNRVIYGARIRPGGRILDGAGFMISTPEQSMARDPEVTFDGVNFLVIWNLYNYFGEGPEDLRGARVSRSGAVLDDASIPISTAPTWKSGLSLAFDGSNHLVVWVDVQDNGATRTLAARVSRAGEVLDRTPIVVTEGYPEAGPAVVFDGTNHLVAAAAVGQVHWVRIAPTGAIVGVGSITARPAPESELAVAFDGTISLVVWTDERDGTSSIYGTRIDRSGNALDRSGFAISTAAGDQRRPAVVANGPFMVVWSDQRRGVGQYDVYGARVRGDGHVIDRRGFAIAATYASEGLPAVAAGPGDRFGVVSQRYVPEAPYGSQRVFLRTVAPK